MSFGRRERANRGQSDPWSCGVSEILGTIRLAVSGLISASMLCGFAPLREALLNELLRHNATRGCQHSIVFRNILVLLVIG